MTVINAHCEQVAPPSRSHHLATTRSIGLTPAGKQDGILKTISMSDSSIPTPLPSPPKGFTLIELLVVITVIAILAGMLLTGLSKAKQTGTMAACLANQKTLILAWTLYTDDNEDRLCSSRACYDRPGNLQDKQIWVFRLQDENGRPPPPSNE